MPDAFMMFQVEALERLALNTGLETADYQRLGPLLRREQGGDCFLASGNFAASPLPITRW
jgi:hypothetical protein